MTNVSIPDGAANGISGRGMRLVFRVLLVGLICHLSTEIGFAHKFPPHYISPLWPTGAILFSVLVATPVRHWLAYTLAAYVTSVVHDVWAGFSTAALLFIVAGILEILIAAVGVRRFAGGLHAFDSLRSLFVYILVAAVLGPIVSAFIAAFAGAAKDYWFFWRVWFFSESLAYLTLAPAIITGIVVARTTIKNASRVRWLEACVISGGQLAVCASVFNRPTVGESSVPTLVYLPLPLLLWAAVRFGPAGVNASLSVVAVLSISGAVHGRGPFTTGTASDNVLSLQMFLIALSVPLMFLAAVIEEGRQKANVLSESEARFRVMTDAAPIMVWMSDTDKRCSYFNKPWLSFTGRMMEQELGDGWAEGVHADDFQRCLKTYNDAFDARRHFEMEYRLRRRDGEYRWVSDHGVPRYDAQGNFAGYIGSCADVTERRAAEEKFRLAVEASPNAIVLVNQQGQIVLVNGQTERQFGYRRAELIGQSIEILVPERLRDRHPVDRARFMAAPAARTMGAGRELFARRKDGTEFPVEVGLNPIQTEEGTFVLSAIIDISARRFSELEIARLREHLSHVGRVSTMGQLASALAHEISQPLGAILRNAEAAELILQTASPDREELRAILTDICKDDHRAGDVIDRLRGLLKRHDIEMRPLSISELLDEVAALTRPDAAARQVHLEIETAPGLPMVKGDRVHLQQVLLNLLLNAMDAVNDLAAERRVVTVRARLESAQTVEVAVSDRGPGIAADKLANIFEPFFTTKSQGMGMGLPISRTIIEAHRGRIWAENNAGGGATFRFMLPTAGEGNTA